MNKRYKEGILLVIGCVCLFVIALYAIYAYTGTTLFILYWGLGIGFEPYSIALIAVPVVLGLIVIALWSYALVFNFKRPEILLGVTMIPMVLSLLVTMLSILFHSLLMTLDPWPRMLLSEILSLFLFASAPLIGVVVVRRYFNYETL